MKNVQPSRPRKLRTFIQEEGPAKLREEKTKFQKKCLIDLASNDYLDLSRHPKLIEATISMVQSHGVGAGASRLITGTRPIHMELEEALANWLGRESVLLFPSGFQANLAAVIALADRHTEVFADRLIHHSLLLGVQASGAKLKRFKHNDLDDLSNKIKLCNKKAPNKTPLVITESLFSMEGTSPPLKEIAELCEQHGAKLLVDEAHALGVIGPQGRGISYGISDPITMVSGTFGKAFGSGGAFLASNKIFREHLIQTSGAFRYSTSLAPPLAAASLAALKLIKDHPNWGIELQANAENLRCKLVANGWSKPSGFGPIIPLIIGSDQDALDMQKRLEEAGLLSVAIRPPTVPEGTARLRIVLRRNLPEDTLTNLLIALGER